MLPSVFSCNSVSGRLKLILYYYIFRSKFFYSMKKFVFYRLWVIRYIFPFTTFFFFFKKICNAKEKDVFQKRIKMANTNFCLFSNIIILFSANNHVFVIHWLAEWRLTKILRVRRTTINLTIFNQPPIPISTYNNPVTLTHNEGYVLPWYVLNATNVERIYKSLRQLVPACWRFLRITSIKHGKNSYLEHWSDRIFLE